MHDTTIDPPADAVTVCPWEDRDGQPVREWEGKVRILDGVEVYLCGTQRVDGSTTRRLVIGDNDFDTDELLAAIRELDQPLRVAG